MATQVGIVKQTSGVVVAVDANGNERVLQAGDAIYLGEVVKTQGLGSNAVLSMDNGNDLSILENDTISVDQSTSDNTSFGTDAVADLSDLQRAILAGEDLSQLEETAAGGDTGAGGDGVGMLNDSVFAQGGHYSNVYADGRGLGSVGAGLTDVFRSLESDGSLGGISVDIVDNRIPSAPDFYFPEDKNKDGTISINENKTENGGDNTQDKTTVRVLIPNDVRPGDTIVITTPEGDPVTQVVPEDPKNPGNPPKEVDVPNVPIKPNGETPVTVRIDTPNNPGTPNTKPIKTDFEGPKEDPTPDTKPDPNNPDDDNDVNLTVKLESADGKDNIISKSEINDGKDAETITGTLHVGADIVVKPGVDTVTIYVDGAEVGKATVQSDNNGGYTYTLENIPTDKFSNGNDNGKTGEIKAEYNAVDKSGNEATIPAKNTYSVVLDGPIPDNTPNTDPIGKEVLLTIDYKTTSGDRIINVSEAQEETQTITGTLKAGGEIVINPGDTVAIYVDGKKVGDANITPDNNGGYTYELKVPTKEFTDGKTDIVDPKEIKAVYNAKDKVGNTTDIDAKTDYTADVTKPGDDDGEDPHSPDNPVNTPDEPQTPEKPEDPVKDKDNSGNEISINAIAGDDLIDVKEKESGKDITITGEVDSQDVRNGGTLDKVIVTVNDKPYEAKVTDNGNGKFTYSVDVPVQELIAGKDKGVNALADITDKAGNKGDVDVTRAYGVDIEGPREDPTPNTKPDPNDPEQANDVKLTVKYDTINGDDVLTAEEAKADKQTVTGTLDVGSDIVVNAGDKVMISVNGNAPVEATLQGSKESGFAYTVEVPTENFIKDSTGKTLDETSKPEVVATYQAKDTAGNDNNITAKDGYSIDTHATIDITHIAGENQIGADTGDTDKYATINTVEKSGFTISGTTDGVEAGQEITIILKDADGTTVTAKANVTDGGKWSVSNVDASSLKAGDVTVTATVTDKVGNVATDTDIATVDQGIEFDTQDPAVVVYEKGLSDGTGRLKDASSLTSDSTELSAKGNLADIAYSFKDLPTDTLQTSSNKPITWSFDNNDKTKIIGTYSDNGVTKTAVEISIDATSSDKPVVKTTLLQPIKHDIQGQDSKDIDVKVVAKNAVGSTADVNVKVSVIDDTPYVTSDSTQAVVVGFEHPKTNVTLVLDYSYSMLYGMNDTKIKDSETDTRLAAAKEGVLKLLDGYSIKGADNVKVNLVMFAGTAQSITSKDGKTWLSVEEAKELINKTYTHAELTSAYQNGDKGYPNSSGINIKTGTNYDAALKVTMDSYKEDGKLSGIDVDNKLYFVSDGMPSVSDGYEGLYNYKAITTAEKVVWHNSSAYYPNGEDESGRFKFAYAGGTYSSGIRYIYFDKDGKWTDEYGRDITSDVKSDLGISASEEKTWRDWLEANQIDAEAFKLSEDASVPLLNPIAYNGSTKSDANAKDFSELALATRPTKGNFIDTLKPSDSTASGKTAIEYGADGDGSLHISVTLNTNQGTMTYVYSPTNNQYTVYEVDNGNRATSHNGSVFTAKMKTGSELTLDMSKGSYEYKPDASIAKSNGSETIDIKYSITDADGDKVEATTTLKAGSAVDYQKIVYGTASDDDKLEGTTGNDVIAGGKGNDTIDGKGGADALLGGEGNDTIYYGKDAKILDGGEGYDTLVIKPSAGRSESIDLSKVANLDEKISNFEKIDLGKNGSSDAIELTIRAEDVLDITDNKNTILKIDGDSSDTIKGSWKETSDVKADGGYKAYEGTTEKGQTIYIQISDDVKTDFN
ncbi:hypothetical protein LMG7974_01250 [Campylobacter majalis]|uniref:VWFA domain-containing protein n=1 Tax=Campylobacter majalis TaxID=2790656 RepID=A0ABN7K8T6_9BACT|nr:retention module-containing protein [Campylobacter majalis]CAD7288939.1 hypothetical protein LMG7974_01250 [Campylobacter majalis]